MKNEWLLSRHVLAEQESWAQEGNYLFSSSSWARVVSALGAESVYAWNTNFNIGILLPVFRRFGLRIGFLGFPVSGIQIDTLTPTKLRAVSTSLMREAQLDFLRTTLSCRSSYEDGAISARPEVWIENLANWGIGNKRLKKDLAFARRRAEAEFVFTNSCNDAQAFYELYAATVGARGGRERYNRSYFDALIRSAKNIAMLRCFFAIDSQGKLAAAAVYAQHGECGYYLHAAANQQAKSLGAGDILLHQIIQYAREQGCQRFSLMASPWEQPGLVRFKKKWGNVSGLCLTQDYANGVLGKGLLQVVRWKGRSDRRHALCFNEEI